MPEDNNIADDVIPGSLKRSKSYHSDYWKKTYKEIKDLASGNPPDPKKYYSWLEAILPYVEQDGLNKNLDYTQREYANTTGTNSPGAQLVTYVPGVDLAQTGAAPITDIGASLNADAPVIVLDADTGERIPYWTELDANTRSSVDWLAVYGGQIDNVRAALEWAFGADGDPSLGVALTISATAAIFPSGAANATQAPAPGAFQRYRTCCAA